MVFYQLSTTRADGPWLRGTLRNRDGGKLAEVIPDDAEDCPGEGTDALAGPSSPLLLEGSEAFSPLAAAGKSRGVVRVPLLQVHSLAQHERFQRAAGSTDAAALALRCLCSQLPGLLAPSALGLAAESYHRSTGYATAPPATTSGALGNAMPLVGGVAMSPASPGASGARWRAAAAVPSARGLLFDRLCSLFPGYLPSMLVISYRTLLRSGRLVPSAAGACTAIDAIPAAPDAFVLYVSHSWLQARLASPSPAAAPASPGNHYVAMSPAGTAPALPRLGAQEPLPSPASALPEWQEEQAAALVLAAMKHIARIRSVPPAAVYAWIDYSCADQRVAQPAPSPTSIYMAPAFCALSDYFLAPPDPWPAGSAPSSSNAAVPAVPAAVGAAAGHTHTSRFQTAVAWHVQRWAPPTARPAAFRQLRAKRGGAEAEVEEEALAFGPAPPVPAEEPPGVVPDPGTVVLQRLALQVLAKVRIESGNGQPLPGGSRVGSEDVELV